MGRSRGDASGVASPVFSKARCAAEAFPQCRGLMLKASTGKSKTIRSCRAVVIRRTSTALAGENVGATAKTTPRKRHGAKGGSKKACYYAHVERAVSRATLELPLQSPAPGSQTTSGITMTRNLASALIMAVAMAAPSAWAQGQPAPANDMQALRAAVKADKKALVAKTLDLTPAEAARSWAGCAGCRGR